MHNISMLKVKLGCFNFVKVLGSLAIMKVACLIHYLCEKCLSAKPALHQMGKQAIHMVTNNMWLLVSLSIVPMCLLED